MKLISAICTPLDDEGRLHSEGLRLHLDDQWQAGIDGVLIGGTMGLLQLLADNTWQDLVQQGAATCRGRGEVLVGVGDCSFDRTRGRIEAVDGLPIDGVVVLPPYFLAFSSAELALYYESLADVSRRPLYLYDLPVRTRVKLDAPLVPAQPLLVDVLAREGADGNLDGIFSLAPGWTREIVAAVAAGDHALAASRQRRLVRLLDAVRAPFSLFPACSAVLNARGIPGSVAPRPLQPLTPAQREQLLALPVVQELVAETAATPA